MADGNSSAGARNIKLLGTGHQQPAQVPLPPWKELRQEWPQAENQGSPCAAGECGLAGELGLPKAAKVEQGTKEPSTGHGPQEQVTSMKGTYSCPMSLPTVRAMMFPTREGLCGT